MRVTTPSGTSSAGDGIRFSYVCAELFGVFPGCGPLSGGNSVCITGSNLHCLSEVFFNRVLITDQEFTVAPSGTFLTLVAPPATTPGPVLVHGIGLVETFPPITCTTSPSIPYTYYPSACPTAIRITPSSGPATGGTAFQIFGSDLYCPTVTIGGVAVPVSTDPPGECVTGVTPPHAPGNAPVVVGRACCPPVTVPLGFTYGPSTPPRPTGGVIPPQGPTAGGNTFLIIGTDLTGALVTFGTVPAINVVVNAAGTSISGIVPAGSGTVPVTVTTPGGSVTLGTPYTYVQPPVISAVSPTVGPESGGNSVTITGSALALTTAVAFGASAASFTVISDSQIVATVPAGSGTVPVTVTTPDGSATSDEPYIYIPPPETVLPGPAEPK
ncbi:IPT/TIG domain-containing protein [Streptomyces decoyicus]